ncbi:hypothetical protein INN71_17695 [Nocardioides sp. ChNu-153]|uniref:hypothetical protein n=1 Tax=unclassified Nocardioides TaxID=2615069 RepID=UPI0024070A5F|nr:MULTISPECIES: hypothetical protein [unclassified Nocardioides]MDF9717669.1 hypothetical protein [Nocardioides sp. ChNu-99]MDN7123218.1 hypothetical protein [Nocardioides sp. ChNu-153]
MPHPPPGPGPVRPARVQHVWVDLTGHWVHPQAGLLMMWRRSPTRPGDWDAFVVTIDQAARAHGGSPRAVLTWVEAAHVRPVRAARTGSRPAGGAP